MLKWMVQPKSRDPSAGVETPDTMSRRVTDDPLASLNVHVKKHNKLGLSSLKRQQEEIYSVTRVNPLFEEAEEEEASCAIITMADEFNSNRSQSKSPTSSGYESLIGDKHLPQTEGKNPIRQLAADDYRRHLALGDWSSRPAAAKTDITLPRLGRATLVQHNPDYVTRIRMSSQLEDWESPSGRTVPADALWEGYALQSLPQNIHPIPDPVWPSLFHNNNNNNNRRPMEDAGSAIVQRNDNYVTKILITPPSSSPAEKPMKMMGSLPEERTMDSIITDSLLMWTSYEFPVDDSILSRPPLKESQIPDRRTSTEAAVRELSETLSQSKTLTTVSRALGKEWRSPSTTLDADYPQPGVKTPSWSSTSGSLVQKKVSQMKDLWERSVGFRSNGLAARLLDEESDDEKHRVRYDNLNQEYVPRNGDINFTPTKIPRQLLQPFSTLATGQVFPRYQTINEIPAEVHQLDPDRISNASQSSSRSSAFRRVTFSADTVDNEPNTWSKAAAAAALLPPRNTSNELKLSPQLLPRYQHPTVEYNLSNEVAVQSAHKSHGQYYASNLRLQSQVNHSQHSQSAKTPPHQHRLWQDKSAVPAGSSANKETYGNLQPHPNYGAACPENAACVDFTLDTQNVSLLQRKSSNDKIRRRLCCCILVLLGAGVFVVVVVGISLYLTHGQRVFGPI